MTKFLNADLDTTLGGSTPSNEKVSSQKAVKTYADTKVAQTSSTNKIYGTDNNGAQTTFATTDFATSVQGAKADTAVQPADISDLSGVMFRTWGVNE